MSLDDEPVLVDMGDFTVHSPSDALRQRVERLVNMVRTTSQTLAESFHLQPVCSTMLFQGAHNEVAPTKTDEDAQPLKIEA